MDDGRDAFRGRAVTAARRADFRFPARDDSCFFFDGQPCRGGGGHALDQQRASGRAPGTAPAMDSPSLSNHRRPRLDVLAETAGGAQSPPAIGGRSGRPTGPPASDAAPPPATIRWERPAGSSPDAAAPFGRFIPIGHAGPSGRNRADRSRGSPAIVGACAQNESAGHPVQDQHHPGGALGAPNAGRLNGPGRRNRTLGRGSEWSGRCSRGHHGESQPRADRGGENPKRARGGARPPGKAVGPPGTSSTLAGPNRLGRARPRCAIQENRELRAERMSGAAFFRRPRM